jgi:hypothetical protein
MRLPPLAVALVTTSAVAATAAVATAQTDPPPFQPEPTTTAPTTTTEPAPPADPSAPTITIANPSTRVGSRIRSLRITAVDTDSSVEYLQIDVTRKIRRAGRLRAQAYDGRRWFTTVNPSKYRITPDTGRRRVTYTLRFRTGLPAASYAIDVRAQNDPGTERRRSLRFRAR